MTAFEGCSPESLGRSHALARRPLATAVADGWPPAPLGATESGLQAGSSAKPALTRLDGASLGSLSGWESAESAILVRSRLAEAHRWHPACGRRSPATGVSGCSGSHWPNGDPTGPGPTSRSLRERASRRDTGGFKTGRVVLLRRSRAQIAAGSAALDFAPVGPTSTEKLGFPRRVRRSPAGPSSVIIVLRPALASAGKPYGSIAGSRGPFPGGARSPTLATEGARHARQDRAGH